jgi:alpha-1,3-mannosyl-glycoprotein beta-1,2-N-acetylglucosaminyltransferase
MVYCRIALHYGWAFARLFETMGLERVIVIEDDLEIAPDFFALFRAVSGLIARDPTIWTVSAWNDNSYPGKVSDPERLFRTDFFPGLGWLMTKALWREVRDRWPWIMWDDWYRRPSIRRGRSVVCPEVSRIYNFGREGTAGANFFDERLAGTAVNTTKVDFEAMDLRWLVGDRYERRFRDIVGAARTIDADMRADDGRSDVKVLYHGEASFNALAERFGLMPAFRDAGLPRMSYRGVVSFRDGARFIHLVPLDFITGAR